MSSEKPASVAVEKPANFMAHGGVVSLRVPA